MQGKVFAMKISSFSFRRAAGLSVLMGTALALLSPLTPARAERPWNDPYNRHVIPTYRHHHHPYIGQSRFLGYPHTRLVVRTRNVYYVPASPGYAAPVAQVYTSAPAGDRTTSAVQIALSRRGYYGGEIDGSIGPGSRNAIARYQQDQGMPVTGTINASLLRSLGL